MLRKHDIAELLRNLREDHDLTQDQVAQLLNISRQGYGNYELKKCKPPIDVLRKLAEYYAISSSDLFEAAGYYPVQMLAEASDPLIPVHCTESLVMESSVPEYSSLNTASDGSSPHGASLCNTINTEEEHLLSSYRKLSVESRTALTGFLDTLDQAGSDDPLAT